jgi:hypothetical protein
MILSCSQYERRPGPTVPVLYGFGLFSQVSQKLLNPLKLVFSKLVLSHLLAP